MKRWVLVPLVVSAGKPRSPHPRSRQLLGTLTHVVPGGNGADGGFVAAQVSVHGKAVTARLAVAEAVVWLPAAAWAALRDGTRGGGDGDDGRQRIEGRHAGETRAGAVLSVARVAGVLASKRTPELIPLCHHVPLDACDVTVADMTPCRDSCGGRSSGASDRDSRVASTRKPSVGGVPAIDAASDARACGGVACRCAAAGDTARGGGRVTLHCAVAAHARTGVEMEAMVGASVAALTLYDMTKAASKGVVVESVRLLSKSGGKSDYVGPPG